MIAFVTTPETAEQVLAAITAAGTKNGDALVWLPSVSPIYSGEHAGKVAIAASDSVFDTVIRLRPTVRVRDYPEFPTLIESLGGLDARVDIDPADLIDPNAEPIIF